MTREMIYRNSAIAGASSIGLMVALLDRLAADLRRAANAIRDRDIETRCREINHGFLVIGQLESWVDREKGGDAARQLGSFYAHLRANIMQASVTESAKLLDEQVETVVHIRTSWQQLDLEPLPPMPGQGMHGNAYANSSRSSVEPGRFSETA